MSLKQYIAKWKHNIHYFKEAHKIYIVFGSKCVFPFHRSYLEINFHTTTAHKWPKRHMINTVLRRNKGIQSSDVKNMTDDDWWYEYKYGQHRQKSWFSPISGLKWCSSYSYQLILASILKEVDIHISGGKFQPLITS